MEGTVEQIKSFILFEATLQSIDMIKDESRKQQLKRYFNIWYKTGIKYWRELDKEINKSEDMVFAYEELSGILYDISSKLINTDKTDDLLLELRETLNKY